VSDSAGFHIDATHEERRETGFRQMAELCLLHHDYVLLILGESGAAKRPAVLGKNLAQ
jgi:hypothetical protein